MHSNIENMTFKSNTKYFLDIRSTGSYKIKLYRYMSFYQLWKEKVCILNRANVGHIYTVQKKVL